MIRCRLCLGTMHTADQCLLREADDPTGWGIEVTRTAPVDYDRAEYERRVAAALGVPVHPAFRTHPGSA